MCGLCSSCCEQSNYISRHYDLGIDGELNLLGLGSTRGGKTDYTSMYARNRAIRTAEVKDLINTYINRPVIEKVVFNDPATIIKWRDGTKTVVKANGEQFDPEKGLAMALAKKLLGNEGNYYEVFKKWVPKEFVEPVKEKPDVCFDYGQLEDVVLPYGGNKSECKGRCEVCCPAKTGSKRNAGPKCKAGCATYDKAFNK